MLGGKQGDLLRGSQVRGKGGLGQRGSSGENESGHILGLLGRESQEGLLLVRMRDQQ